MFLRSARLVLFAAYVLAGCFFGISSQAKIDVLFHPTDPTLQGIADLIEQKPTQIQIAMYNIDTSDKNPIIAALKKPEIQGLIESQEMQILMIFEGYGTPDENNKKMEEISQLGVQVRFLKSGKKVHHKYALFYFNDRPTQLVTGSANWSLSSFRNYNENILFIENEDHLIGEFSTEFKLLWENSGDFGSGSESVLMTSNSVVSHDLVSAAFTSDNFVFSNGQVRAKPESSGYTVTKEIVQAIDQSQNNLKIATTRIKLRPIYEAILRAARRGVKVQLVVSMDEYERNHSKLEVPSCNDPYQKSCSSGVSFTSILDRDHFEGHENVDVRIKFYSLHLASYVTYQMHNKYMIVDDKLVLTGSFNWSYSSEYEHIENLVVFDDSRAANRPAVQKFLQNFSGIWDMNRGLYSELVKSYQEHSSVKCSFSPMVLDIAEIDLLLKTAGRKKCL